MAPTMELSYFEGPGRADAIRILLHAAKADWKNVHVGYGEFAALKPSLPLGCLPTLTIDGTVFCQSVSLQRYVAKQVGLYPTDNYQALVADELMDSLNECLDKCPFSGTDEEKKVSRPAFQKDVMTPYFTLVESRLKQFGGATQTVCGVFSVADIYLMSVVDFFTMDFMEYLDKEFFQDYPTILAVVAHCKENDVVKNYQESLKSKKRPHTDEN